MCVHGFLSFLIDLPFPTFFLCLCSFSFTFLFEHIFIFFHVTWVLSIVKLVLLTIEGKWLEAIVHMKEFEFLDLSHPKQVQLLISINIHGKF